MIAGSGRIPDCHPDQPHAGHGMCRKCYLAKYRKEHRDENTRPYDIRATCHPDRPHKARGLCIACYKKEPDVAAKIKAYTVVNRRRDLLKHRYGLDIATYDALAASQNNVCAICGQPPRGKMQRLSVDHDHDSGKVRGLLCITCNRTIGYLDNPEWRSAADRYLESHTF
jgi:hypothetical protein